MNRKVQIMIVGAILLGMTVFNSAFAQDSKTAQAEKIRAENKVLLELFKNFRVADVRDAMDWIGYQNFGSMDPAVHPLFRTKAVGIARTARYLPYVGPYPTERGDDYTRWQGWYYNTICTYPWMNDIEDGDFIAIDVSGVNVGLLGSENTLRALLKGARGFVINGSGIRDVNEVVNQKIPVWSHFVAQSMVQSKMSYSKRG